MVIEELKETLARAYERERTLESALAEARATNDARADAADAADAASSDAGVDVSFSAAAVAEKPEDAPSSSEKSSPVVREKLRRSVADLDRLRERITRLAHEASYERSVERSADVSEDVSAYHDAPTPDSVRAEERRMLRNAGAFFAGAGAGPFAESRESRVAFSAFSAHSPFGAAAPPGSVSPIDVSAASTPPDYDARRFADLLRRGEEGVRKLKARAAAFESAGREE